jgi:folate-dependent phosphoribosylglycinamide formyltransferase PurN
MKHESFALILGDSFRHKLFFQLVKLGGLEPEVIIMVRSRTFFSRVWSAPSSTIFSLFQDLAESFKMPILRFKSRFALHNSNCIFVRDVNDNSAYELLRTLQPSLIFVYGSNVIKSKLLSIDSVWLNAHGGVLPGYRGLDSNLWAISEDRFNLVGYSIHKVVSRLDAGEILISTRVEVNSLVDLLTIRLRIAKELSRALVTLLSGEISFRTRDFRPNILKDSVYRSYIVLLPLLSCIFRVLRKGLQ